MKIDIRSMNEADDKIVGQILSEAWRFISESDGLTEEQLNRMFKERCLPEHIASIRSRYDCSVAETHGNVVGMIAVGGNNIEELWVRPSHHRQGIGTALFRHAEQSVHGGGHTQMTVSTTGFGRPFYEAMGMHIAGSRRVTFGPLEGRDLIVLNKELGITNHCT